LEDAGLTISEENASRIGVVMNTGGGGFGAIETETRVLLEKGHSRVSPYFVTSLMPSMCACYVSIICGLKGPVITSVAACASGTYAYVEALRLLRRGEAEVVVAGGTEAGITPLGFAGLGAVRAMSTRNEEPAKACRPFDRDRDGLVFGEGAGVMVVETLEHARRRGAKIYAELLGGSITGDAYHITAPDPNGDGATLAMQRALEDSGLRPGEIDYISAHGTATRLNDPVETMAIKRVFGEHAYQLAISSTKSMLGHMLGAAGAASTIAAVLTTKHGIIPPTINLDNPDPECDLDYVPHVARQQPVRVAMVNAFGFGGQNSVVIVKRWDGLEEERRGQTGEGGQAGRRDAGNG
jgi:3-oxoacyl-[acyl-carrier-protein] synthase II